MPNVFTQSLWGDEGFSAILSMKPFGEMIKIVANDTSPPLWNISEWLAFRLFGTGEPVIRALSLFFFLITVFFVYKIGALIWNKKTGLLAGLLTALNPFFFTYAFEGRMYSIMAAGVAGSFYFFLKILKSKKPSKESLVGYVAFTLWALYSHHFAIFSVITQGLWFLYDILFGNNKAGRRIFKGFVFVALGYIPWLLPLYNQFTKVAGGFWLGRPDAKDLTFLLGEYLGAGVKHDLSFYALPLTLGVLIFRRWGKKKKENLILASWFLIPVLLTWGISQVFQPIFFNRYLLYTIPGAMILVASNRTKISNILIGAVIILYAMVDWFYFTNPAKIPFQNLAVFVKETRVENSLIINEDAGSHKLWEAKYYGIPAPIYSPEGNELPFFVGTALMAEEDFVDDIPDETLSLGVITPKEGASLKIEDFITTEEKRFGNLNFVWMERD